MQALYKYPNRFYFNPIILLLVIFVQACGVSAKTSLMADIVTPPTSLVLDATDLLDISELPIKNIDLNQLPGQYKSEQGGAILYLTIKQQNKDSWIVERIYTEPSIQDISKRYTVYKTALGLADKKGHLILQQTKVGLIMYESHSGLDSIPTDYWIHYIKQKQ